jgi:hypothetical protein
MISRDIGCAHFAPGRAGTICGALAESMTWMGHAMIAPGWRVTWNALRQVYCREGISPVDLPALEYLKQGSDGRLENGADGRAAEPENSIFSPANPQYILKHGWVGIE